MVLNSKTKNMAVYEKVRQDIISGKLKPGQKIVISNLVKEYGLSATPVREAIIRLQSDGYVNFTPHLGAVVSKIDERELISIYLIRIELESLATRLAAPRITDKDIEFLEHKNREMELAIEQKENENLGSLNKEFHLRIYKAAHIPRLYNMICDLWEAFERSQSVFSYVPERAIASVVEHRKIVEAFKRKDTELAERLTKEQKERTMEALKRFTAQGD